MRGTSQKNSPNNVLRHVVSASGISFKKYLFDFIFTCHLTGITSLQVYHHNHTLFRPTPPLRVHRQRRQWMPVHLLSSNAKSSVFLFFYIVNFKLAKRREEQANKTT